VGGDENMMPATKEEVGAEKEPSVVKEETRVRKDAVQNDEVHMDEATERLLGNPPRGSREGFSS
jgi:hypothetical protein